MGQKFEIRSSSNPHQYVLLCNLIHHSWDFLLNLGWGHLLLVGVADASIGEDPFLSLPRTHEFLYSAGMHVGVPCSTVLVSNPSVLAGV